MLYHYMTGFPDVEVPTSILARMTEHAMKEAIADRYYLDEYLPYYNDNHLLIKVSEYKVVEMEVDNEQFLKKVVLRKQATQLFDIIIVAKRKNESDLWRVATVWSNNADDDHKTIDLTPYVKVNAMNAIAKMFAVRARVYQVEVNPNGKRQFLGWTPWETVQVFDNPVQAYSYLKEHQQWPIEDGRLYKDRDLELEVARI